MGLFNDLLNGFNPPSSNHSLRFQSMVIFRPLPPQMMLSLASEYASRIVTRARPLGNFYEIIGPRLLGPIYSAGHSVACLASYVSPMGPDSPNSHERSFFFYGLGSLILCDAA